MDPDLQPRRSDESVGDLVNEVTGNASTLIRQEVALVKAELREEIREAVTGISLLSAAGVIALLAGLMLSMAAGLGIGRAMGEGWTWLGFVIVGVAYLVIAGIAGLMGRKKADEATPPAPRSTRQAQKTADAAKEIRL